MTPFDDGRIEELIAAVQDAAEDETTYPAAEYSVAERAYAMETLFNRGEYEHLQMFLPPHHVHDMRPVHVPGMDVYRGRSGYRKFVQDWTETFPGAILQTEFAFEVSEPVEAVFMISKQEVRGGASDVPVAFRFALIAEDSGERSETLFGTDLEEMRQTFRSRYGQDPGPFDLEPLLYEERQQA